MTTDDLEEKRHQSNNCVEVMSTALELELERYLRRLCKNSGCPMSKILSGEIEASRPINLESTNESDRRHMSQKSRISVSHYRAKYLRNTDLLSC